MNDVMRRLGEGLKPALPASLIQKLNLPRADIQDRAGDHEFTLGFQVADNAALLADESNASFDVCRGGTGKVFFGGAALFDAFDGRPDACDQLL
jgi:hypothetical protein